MAALAGVAIPMDCCILFWRAVHEEQFEKSEHMAAYS